VTFDIRKAEFEDVVAIIEVLDHAPFLMDCYRGEGGISLIEKRLDWLWLVDLNGQVASVMIVLPKNDLGLLEIRLIVTKPWFRRRGFARAAIHKAKLLAADSGLDLTAYAENDVSRDLLASEGFELVRSGKNKLRRLERMAPIPNNW
jgi:N-acetylglutamate synthase-like GNAT family acetyltransferase